MDYSNKIRMHANVSIIGGGLLSFSFTLSIEWTVYTLQISCPLHDQLVFLSISAVQPVQYPCLPYLCNIGLLLLSPAANPYVEVRGIHFLTKININNLYSITEKPGLFQSLLSVVRLPK